MLPIITSTIAGFISFALLDYLWLAKIAKNFYLDKLATHVKIKDGSLVPYLPAVPLVYIVGILAIWIFVLSFASDTKHAIAFGAVLGLLMYAFYDFTNLATLKDYSWSIAIVDIVWGGFIVGAVSGIMYYIRSIFA